MAGGRIRVNIIMQFKRAVLATVLSTLVLTGCGGGGGGGGGGASTSTSNTSAPPPATVTPDGSSRTISSSCPFQQNLGAARGDNLHIDSVRWLQTVEMVSDAPDTRLAGGKAVKVRIDLLASDNQLAPTRRELRVYNPADGSCTVIPVDGPSRVPAARDGDTLNSAFVANIPASLVKPGMTASLVFDDGSGRSAGEADQTYRVLVPSVAPAVKEVLRIIPLTLLGSTGYNSSQIAELITRLYPVSEVEVHVESPLNITTSLLSSLTLSGGIYSGTVGLMQNLLNTVDDLCATLNGSQTNPRTAPKCLALVPDNLIFSASGGGQTTGLAYVGGIAMVARSVASVDITNVSGPYDASHWITYNAMTVAHEYGHLLDLDHAACGGATGIDPRLYADGHLGGVPGYDATRNVYFASSHLNAGGQPMFSDVMSYCGKEWVSDRGYLATMAYRAGSADQAAARTTSADSSGSTSTQWLKIALTPKGWKIRHAGFAPSTLETSKMQLEVSSDKGVETLSVLSAVISEHHDTAGFGPFYINLGDRHVSSLRLLSDGVEMTRWGSSDL